MSHYINLITYLSLILIISSCSKANIKYNEIDNNEKIDSIIYRSYFRDDSMIIVTNPLKIKIIKDTLLNSSAHNWKEFVKIPACDGKMIIFTKKKSLEYSIHNGCISNDKGTIYINKNFPEILKKMGRKKAHQ